MRRFVLHIWNLLFHNITLLLRRLLPARVGDCSHQTPTHSSELIAYTRSEFPIRVVDVEKTLKNQRTVVFKKPETWQDFHIISHTWSQMVRDLSVEIGASIAPVSCSTSSSPGTIDSYAATFQEADLSRNRCYMELSRVLEWLASDGVKGVWMDALCINQTDVNEKSQEISRMGDYYGKSQGCYVIPNGIGQMYGHLCSQPSPSEREQNERRPHQVLPRWFYRVWTLQEYLLPSHLSFLVGDLQPALIRLINAFIRSRSKSAVGFCNCCCIPAKDDSLQSLLYRNMNPHHRHPDPVQAEKDALVSEAFMNHVERLIDAGDQSTNTDPQGPPAVTSTLLECIDGSQIVAESSGDVCGECGSRPLIRRVASCSTMYFVEAPAYDVLLCLVTGSKWERAVGGTSSQLRSMKEAAAAAAAAAADDHKKYDILEIFSVTALRDCSHEEDRVLGILGLLHGFHERQLDQLRANKTMDEQVVFVARHNFEFAFSLVVYSGDCFLQVPGLSWAADLRDNGSNPHGGSSLIPSGIFNSRSGRYNYGCVRLAQITKVTPQGLLHVSARVARGRLRYLAPSSNRVSDSQSSWRLHNVEGCPAIDGAGLPDTRDLLSATLKVGQITDDDGCPLSSLEFDVHLIILESFIKPPPARRAGQPGYPCVRIMVCCGRDPQCNLHNLYNTYVSATQILAACPSTPIDCQIGGYGMEIPREALTNACLEFKRGKVV